MIANGCLELAEAVVNLEPNMYEGCKTTYYSCPICGEEISANGYTEVRLSDIDHSDECAYNRAAEILKNNK